MRVRYDADKHPLPDVDGGATGWLTTGRDYQVIEVFVEAVQGEHRASFRLAADDGTPALFDARCFSVVGAAIPPSWNIELTDGYTTIGPPEFQVPGFWESFFDGEQTAVATFQRVLAES